MHAYTFTETDLTHFANQVKDALLVTLAAEEILVGEPDVVAATYAVTIVEGSRFGELWNKLRKIKDQGLRIFVVKCTDGIKQVSDG